MGLVAMRCEAVVANMGSCRFLKEHSNYESVCSKAQGKPDQSYADGNLSFTDFHTSARVLAIQTSSAGSSQVGGHWTDGYFRYRPEYNGKGCGRRGAGIPMPLFRNKTCFNVWLRSHRKLTGGCLRSLIRKNSRRPISFGTCLWHPNACRRICRPSRNDTANDFRVYITSLGW